MPGDLVEDKEDVVVEPRRKNEPEKQGNVDTAKKKVIRSSKKSKQLKKTKLQLIQERRNL